MTAANPPQDQIPCTTCDGLSFLDYTCSHCQGTGYEPQNDSVNAQPPKLNRIGNVSRNVTQGEENVKIERFTASLLIKGKASTKRIRVYSREFSQEAVDNLVSLFATEMITDPSRRAKEELLSGLNEAREALLNQNGSDLSKTNDAISGYEPVEVKDGE